MYIFRCHQYDKAQDTEEPHHTPKPPLFDVKKYYFGENVQPCEDHFIYTLIFSIKSSL
jgi:hypothetical protein